MLVRINTMFAMSTYRVPSHFNEDIGPKESFPRVCLARSFARLVHCALRDEHWQNLVDYLTEDGEEDEDTQHLVLEATLGVFCVEKRETDE